MKNFTMEEVDNQSILSFNLIFYIVYHFVKTPFVVFYASNILNLLNKNSLCMNKF